MTSDKNKNISQIQDNHLNLPSKIQWQNGNNIVYQYNAAGIKISKNVNVNKGNQMINTPTLYLDGYQYVNGNLEFFPVAGAYVKKTESTEPTKERWYDYVFNYTDHLGNIRLSYTFDYNTNKIKILEENHYYPFGLKHRKYNNLSSYIQFKPNISNRGLMPIVKGKTYKYKYQGQERQDELNLNWDSFKWRNYDFAIGRFMSVDPLAEKYNTWSPYVFSGNRVVDARELEGLEPVQILKFNSNHGFYGGYNFTPPAVELLHLVSGVSKQAIRNVVVQKRAPGQYRPFYSANKGGGAITLGTSSINANITITESFFNSDSKSYNGNGFGNDIMTWMGLMSHEVGHLPQIDEEGGFFGYISEFIGQYIDAGNHDGAPYEIDAEKGAENFEGFNNYLNNSYGEGTLNNLFKTTKEEDQRKGNDSYKINMIIQYWNEYQESLHKDTD